MDNEQKIDDWLDKAGRVLVSRYQDWISGRGAEDPLDLVRAIHEHAHALETQRDRWNSTSSEVREAHKEF